MEDIQVSKNFSIDLCTAFANRLAKTLKIRRKWALPRSIEAFRIYDLDIPELPLMVDVYGEGAVVYERFLDDLTRESFSPLLEIIADAIKIPKENVFLKKRRRQKGLSQYQKLSGLQKEMVISEGELKFIVNLTDYLDTGLFLDHRPIRLWLAKKSLPKMQALNLFSYTGSISVALAKAGCRVTSVDLSNTYQNWAKKNFSLNAISPDEHRFINDDILVWLKNCSKGALYDLIVFDPPSFSNSTKMNEHFDLVKHHAELLLVLKKMLKPQGFIIFSGNKTRFSLAENVSHEFCVLNVSKESIPSDFRNAKIHFCYLLGKDNQNFTAIAREIFKYR